MDKQKQEINMRAFTNTLVSYDDFIADVQLHKTLDQYVQGTYWNDDNQKGCAVGCVLHTFLPKVVDKLPLVEVYEYGNHGAFEPMFGIPRIVARLQDRIFEGLPIEDAKEFPLQFAQAIKVGSDYANVWNKFAYWLLFDSEKGVIRFASSERTKAAITQVATLYERAANGDNPTFDEWRESRAAAYATATATADATAAYAAYAAAAYAAADAAASAAATATAYAASAAATATATAATATAYADAATAAATATAAAYADADAAARFNHFKMQRDKLLALLAEG